MPPRQVRAPQDNGGVVAFPPPATLARTLEANHALSGPALLGRTWEDLRVSARQALLQAARNYLQEAGASVPDVAGDRILMAGHQPELFHPGVWVKNFALHGLARLHHAVPVNLVVDNDIAREVAIPVPAVEIPLPAHPEMLPHIERVPFDAPPGEAPYEERHVQDEALFASLPERVRSRWNFRPILPEFWAEVCQHISRTSLLGERLASGRRALERRWGCHNLEIPVSRVCATEPFAWFAVHMLAHLPRLHAVYNESVHAYRRQYGLRSKNHPVPDLLAEGDWHEVPFWAWRSGDPRRGRLLARRRAGVIDLRASGETWPSLPVPEDAPEAACTAWLDLARQGYKVRSRALTNTLYARLFLCDLFVHGIGGGKYDEVTDVLIRRFYNTEPPDYMVLSATLLLPLPTYPARPADLARLRHLQRDLVYNPQRHLDERLQGDPTVASLRETKQRLIAYEPDDSRGRRHRFRELRELTQQLRQRLASRMEAVQTELHDCERQLHANAILQRRDYPFCLYPEETLRPFCSRFLSGEMLS